MQHLARCLFGFCLALLVSQSATAADYVFTLYNNTTKYTITGFQTYENDTWTRGRMSGWRPARSSR